MSNTLDACQTGYDYEQYQMNELENENMKLKEQIAEANEIIKGFSKLYEVYPAGNGIIIFNVVKPPSLENYIKKWSVKWVNIQQV